MNGWSWVVNVCLPVRVLRRVVECIQARAWTRPPPQPRCKLGWSLVDLARTKSAISAQQEEDDLRA